MYRKLALVALVLILAALVLGGYVRVVGAGLACPDAPFCYGYLWPPKNLPAQALKAYPGFAYDPFQAGLQMGHRLLAWALGGVLLGLAGLAWWQANRRVAGWGALGLLTLYALQLGLGAALVKSRLLPVLVTGHWLVAVLMAALAWRWYLALKPREPRQAAGTDGLRRWASLAGWVTLAQLVLGGWMGANFAGFACPDFPTCQGLWWPPMDWRALAFWEQWGKGLTEWALLDTQARITLHWIHRLGAVVVFFTLFGLAIRISSNPKVPYLSKLGLLLNFLLLAEIASGMGALRYAWPVLTVTHSLIGVTLLLTVLTVGFYLRYPPFVPETARLPEVETFPPSPKPETVFERLRGRLAKTRYGLIGFLASGGTLNENLAEEIETHLLLADVGVAATQEILKGLNARLARRPLRERAEVVQALRDILLESLAPCSKPLRIDLEHKPFVILVVGVNGVGKTTTIGKLAQRFKRQGYSVMLAAGDTFRAAAVEQLKTWGERNQVPVVAQHPGADSAAVIYDALQSAKARGIDVLIADTAGRLHTKSNLMEELAKIKRILAKLDPTAPHEVLLVLDATTGQNALAQAEQFNQAVGVSGLVLTKLDGTAKGGVIFALAKRFGIPIRFIGIGEGIEDLQDFEAQTFIDALFAGELETRPAAVH
ncbi:hypothetical protein JCM13664_00440 [Methylothermus subterraneus]